MKVKITIEADLEFTGGGPFATKDDVAEKLVDEVESMDPGEVYADEQACYGVNDWAVEDV